MLDTRLLSLRGQFKLVLAKAPDCEWIAGDSLDVIYSMLKRYSSLFIGTKSVEEEITAVHEEDAQNSASASVELAF